MIKESINIFDKVESYKQDKSLTSLNSEMGVR